MVDERLKSLVERYEVRDLLTGGVLLVDDDAPNLEVLSGVLENDYTVHQAESGAEALEILARVPVDVIVADQRMPGMTGVELLERVSATHPDVAGIVLTGYTDTPAIIAAINRAKAFLFLTKPWEEDEIKMAVAQASNHVYQRRAIVRLVDLVSRRNEELAMALAELRAAQDRMLHLERLGTIGRLTAGITHDLRNFLMGLALLEEEFQTRAEVAPDLRDTVTIGLHGARNLLATLETMNQFARGGKMVVEHRPVSVERVIHDAVIVMRGDIQFRRRDVKVRVAEGIPDILGDHTRLVQALVNLIRNAVQATKEGQRISIEASVDPDGRVVLSVEDEGPGIPPEVRSRLGEAFVSTKGDEGMGMGLFMARLIAEGHHGCIEVPTDTAAGAVVRLTMNAANT